MRMLVTGASGFVGSLLIPRLLTDGHDVRALGRDPRRVHAALAAPGPPADADRLEVVRGDALSGSGLGPALAGVEVAYYLIHSMESGPEAPLDFAERERIAAENFAAAAAAAGVRRIIYLGGLLPTSQPQIPGAALTRAASEHLLSRAEVERILLGAVADSLALRASIVIGARSRSFRLLVRLLERIPVLALPAWQRFRTQPIDARDVIAMLRVCAAAKPPRRSLEIAGPEVLTYGEILERIADLMLIARPALKIGVNMTGLTARVAAAIAGEDPALVLPLMEGLQGDLLPASDDAAALLNVRLHSFDAAVEHALADWERTEPLAAR
jgi:uncharacterized protein YbjT (DUF2867 family)